MLYSFRVDIAELLTLKNENFNSSKHKELTAGDRVYQVNLDLMSTDIPRAVSLIEDYFLEGVSGEVDLSPMLAVKKGSLSLEIIYVPLEDFTYTYSDDRGHANCEILVNAIEAYFKAEIFKV